MTIVKAKVIYRFVKGYCCAYCNPVNLADFERDCIVIARINIHETGLETEFNRTVICRRCILAMALGLETQTMCTVVPLRPEIVKLLGAV
jgi:hypothetical protein